MEQLHFQFDKKTVQNIHTKSEYFKYFTIRKYFQDFIRKYKLGVEKCSRLSNKSANIINQFLNSQFSALDSKKSRWTLASAIGIYAIFFMNLYVPFNVQKWPQNIDMPQFLYLSAFGIVAWVYLILTQIVLKEHLNFQRFTNKHFIVWTTLELLLISFLMALLFGERQSDLLHEYWLAIKQSLLVGLIPYSGVILYFKFSEKNRRSISTNHLVKITDSNGDLKLVVDNSQLLFLNSADNYVEVYYLKDGLIKKELVRTTLKILEHQLSNQPIRRCQRSYMVNINRVAVIQKNSQGYNIELNGYDKPIPVSKNYKQYFVDLLNDLQSE
ncbi:MAG: LytTR family DNA-binding domain-containing protein [Reichenbachiella sp.]|uniref:LytTR family DNA-binding domain-containing protein n=1 Tax=Reichenbachiella sp. TaxID=2184521 RepID=UPI003297B866